MDPEDAEHRRASNVHHQSMMRFGRENRSGGSKAEDRLAGGKQRIGELNETAKSLNFKYKPNVLGTLRLGGQSLKFKRCWELWNGC